MTQFKNIPYNEELDRHCTESTIDAVRALIAKGNEKTTTGKKGGITLVKKGRVTLDEK